MSPCFKRIVKMMIMLLASLLLVACEGESKTQVLQSNSATDTVYKWKMVTSWPPNFPVFQEGAERFADNVRVMSRGRLDIQVYSARQLVGPLEVFDAVTQGSVQMGHGSAYYWAGKVPAAQFLSSVPFGMTAKGMNSWFYSGGGLEIWRELYEPFNVVPFPVGNTGVQMGGWFNKKIESVDDLKGLKMRIPGLGGKVLAKAGGNPVLMGGGDLYTALDRGTLDATEWVGPFHDMRLGLQRAAKYYYTPGWHEPGTALELIVGKSAWDSLPADLQKIIEVAAAAENQWVYSQFETLNLGALRELKEKHGIEVLEFPADVMAELKRLSVEALDEEADKNADFKRVYEAYKAFHADFNAWSKVADDAYQRAIQ